ncbi:hypothetical protein [Xenorhabdus littoralis]|uniref:hypothetical protein n=1 Tax=Xenorhabdus littoralis TaxID=2582835 RepID=UPI0029E7E42D|nr:hypothetical protein [Xenorhabdus sp. psl]MDX7990358.1 hypothetical protein [Xenorhabdus sp. psl]
MAILHFIYPITKMINVLRGWAMAVLTHKHFPLVTKKPIQLFLWRKILPLFTEHRASLSVQDIIGVE